MKKKSTGSTGSKNNMVLIGVIAAVAIALFGVFTYTAQKTMETEVYYELNQPVLAKQVITADMVTEVATKKGTAPATAISMADIQSGLAQSKYPLNTDEILTYGNVGSSSDNLHDSLLKEKEDEIATMEKNGDGNVEDYKNWVLTSFSVGADNAMGGRITPGTYFDIMVITEKGAFYPFINVKAIDTTVSLSGASSAQAADSSEAYAGQTSQYVVQLSPDDAARLQWFMSNFDNIKLVLNDKSDVKSDGSATEADARGANKYDGYDSATEGKYEGFEQISPNIASQEAERNSSTDPEKIQQEASAQAERAREERAAQQASSTAAAASAENAPSAANEPR